MKVRRKIFIRSPKGFFLGVIVFSLLLVLLFVVPAAHARQILHYKTYHPESGKEFNRFHCLMEKNSSGGYQVHWTIEESGVITEEDYTLNEHFETLRFKVVNIKEKTDYAGERKGNTLLIQGQFKGEEIAKTVLIDDRPFYYNPKIGLAAFIRSGGKQIRFWGFQNKELKAYPMKAINEGLEWISVSGEDIEAVKVYWTVDDFRSAFFRRTYWFRPSDGLYLKQKTDAGKFRELISEEGGLE